MQDQDIHQRIGQILFNCGPSNALELIVRAEIFPENDGGKYEFDYLDESGNLDWFDPDGRAIADLTDALVELKKYFIDNKMTPVAFNGNGGSGCLRIPEIADGIVPGLGCCGLWL